MFRRVALAIISVMSVVLLPAAPLHAVTCNLSTDQTEYPGGDDMIVFLGVDFDRAVTVDLYFSLSLGDVSIYRDGQGFYESPLPWIAGVPVPQGLRFSGVPIFAIPHLPFGLPDSATAGVYTWQLEMKQASESAAACTAPFTFTCEGGVRNVGQPYLTGCRPA